MALSEGDIRALTPQDRPYKVTAEHSLYLLVTPSGGKLWRLDFEFRGKRRTMALGRWPDTKLRDARAKREDVKRQLRAGIDPAKPREPDADTFEVIARQWHETMLPGWSEKYGAQVLARLEADVFPALGALPISTVRRSDVLGCLQKVEARGVFETTRRLKQYVGSIFRFAGATDDSINDPTPGLKGRLKAPPKAKHYPSLKRGELGGFLVKLDSYPEPLTRLALRFLILTATRTTEVRGARWSEIENRHSAKKALWRIPAERMKMKAEHLVPLSEPALEVLEELRTHTGKSACLFPGRDGGLLSQNTLLFAVYRLGYRGRATPHGFRSSFSTIANESGRWNADWIEMQLAHEERDESRGAYNAAQYFEGRRELVTWWADELAALKRRAALSDAERFLGN